MRYTAHAVLTLLISSLPTGSLQAAKAPRRSNPPSTRSSHKGATHTVRRGETAAAIAHKAGLSVDQLASFNPDRDLAHLRPGTVLHLRAEAGKLQVAKAEAADDASRSRTVLLAKGETLFALAHKEGIAVSDILAANPGLKPSRARAGMRINLPLSEDAADLTPGAVAETRTAARTEAGSLPAVPSGSLEPLIHLERILPPEVRPAVATAEPAPGTSSALVPAAPSAPTGLAAELQPVVPPQAEGEAQHPSFAEPVPVAFTPADPSHLDLLWPVETRTISSVWGPRMRTKTVRVRNHRKKRVRYRGRHRGVDLTAPIGTAVYAAMDGRVIVSGKHRQYGNYIIVDHGNGVCTLYAHHSLNIAQEGEIVRRGQKIAEVGRTGNATGPHLHFELQIGGERLNPLPVLNDEEEIPAELAAQNATLGHSR